MLSSSNTAQGSNSGQGPRTLVVKGLKKSYGSTQALRDLSLSVESQQIIGVVGPNGAGKSTLVKILAGEESEDAGTITVGGTELLPEQRRRFIAVVHQEPQLFPNLSVVENLMIDNEGLRRPKPTPAVFELLESLQTVAGHSHSESTAFECTRQRKEISQIIIDDEDTTAIEVAVLRTHFR